VTAPPDADVPAWFARALAALPEHRDVEVDGTRVHYRVWGPAGAPGLVLVHGGAAHSGWWDHVAPLLTSHRVVALDLSGHGDSGRREIYDMRQWAREIVTVTEAEALDRPVVVGHSMGGWVAVTTGVEQSDAVSAVAYIDSPLNDQPPEESRLQERRRPRKVYPSLEEAVARFRTLPAQDVVLPFVRDHVARGSLRAVDGGWTWAFDPDFFGTRLRLRDLLPGVGTPLALLRCEHGLVSAAMGTEMAGLVRGGMPVVELPDAGHHPMLDQPLALVAVLRTLLATWPAGRAAAAR